MGESMHVANHAFLLYRSIGIVLAAFVLYGCGTPCPETAKAVRETCSCNPTERALLNQARALDPVLRTAFSECLSGASDGTYSKGATPIEAKVNLKGCIEKTSTLDDKS